MSRQVIIQQDQMEELIAKYGSPLYIYDENVFTEPLPRNGRLIEI